MTNQTISACHQKRSGRTMAVNPPNAEQAKMLNNLLKSLSPADTAKLNQILNDKEATSRVLSTPQAQELLKKLTGKG